MLADINVTPLVDVMLVLLIIFMVTAPILQQGVDVDLPEARAQTIDDDEGKLILTATKDRRVFIGRTEIPVGSTAETRFALLETKLRANAKVRAERQLYLHADKALPYGFVVELMAAAKRSGVDKLGMVADPLQ
jgi:biopolymer transport protein TolR